MARAGKQRENTCFAFKGRGEEKEQERRMGKSI